MLGDLQPLPLMSIYKAANAAVNAFSESVALELGPLGVRVRIMRAERPKPVWRRRAAEWA